VQNFVGKPLKNGGVSIFIQETLQFTIINLNEFCKEQYLEVSTVKLRFSPITFVFYLFIDLQLEISCIFYKH
jgi:hypothetical protein